MDVVALLFHVEQLFDYTFVSISRLRDINYKMKNQETSPKQAKKSTLEFCAKLVT